MRKQERWNWRRFFSISLQMARKKKGIFLEFNLHHSVVDIMKILSGLSWKKMCDPREIPIQRMGIANPLLLSFSLRQHSTQSSQGRSPDWWATITPSVLSWDSMGLEQLAKKKTLVTLFPKNEQTNNLVLASSANSLNDIVLV